jgi:predicted lysophospholipase L1 biosynthesis ABC-type transport system permease subunit
VAQRQAGELNVQIGDVVTMLVSKKQIPAVLDHT